MFEKELDKLYIEMAQQVNNMIPVEWEEFWLCADLDDDCNGGVYFFFKEKDGSVIYSLDIPKMYSISRKQFDLSDLVLFDIAKKMKHIFINNHLEPWYQMVLGVNSEKKINC